MSGFMKSRSSSSCATICMIRAGTVPPDLRLKSTGATPARNFGGAAVERSQVRSGTVPDEGEKLRDRPGRLSHPGGEDVGTDAVEIAGFAVEGDLGEAVPGEPLPDRGSEVGFLPVSGPDDTSPGAQHRRQVRDGASDVLVADVSEHTTHECEVDRYDGCVDGWQGGVGREYLDIGQAGHRDRTPCRVGVVRVEFDQQRPHVLAAGMRGERSD